MQIQFERTGGFAGMRIAAAIDLESLAPQDEHELRHLVDAAGFFRLPQVITESTPNADRFVYRVTVEAEEQRHTVEVSEGAVPSSLRPLLEWLTAAGRRGQRGGGAR